MTPDTGQMQLTAVYSSHTCMLTALRRGHCAMQGHIAVVLGNRVDNWGLWEADFVVSRGGCDSRSDGLV